MNGFDSPGVDAQTHTNKHAYQLPGQKQFQETRCTPGFKRIRSVALIFVQKNNHWESCVLILIEIYSHIIRCTETKAYTQHCHFNSTKNLWSQLKQSGELTLQTGVNKRTTCGQFYMSLKSTY